MNDQPTKLNWAYSLFVIQLWGLLGSLLFDISLFFDCVDNLASHFRKMTPKCLPVLVWYLFLSSAELAKFISLEFVPPTRRKSLLRQSLSVFVCVSEISFFVLSWKWIVVVRVELMLCPNFKSLVDWRNHNCCLLIRAAFLVRHASDEKETWVMIRFSLNEEIEMQWFALPWNAAIIL